MPASLSLGDTTTTMTPLMGPLVSSKPSILWVHDPSTTSFHQDAVVNPDAFPTIQDGQLLRLHFARSQNNGPHVEPIIVKAAVADREAIGRQQQLQISLCKDIADRLQLRFRKEVFIELIDTSMPGVVLDHVELGFKEQYLGRSDMWRLQQHLASSCVYLEKKILFAGSIKTTVKKLWSGDNEVFSGYINDHTKIVFRSGSAKYFLFIQMSREMWEFDEDGELYFEKVVNHFLPQLFHRWKDEGTNHVVSIVLFTRVFYDGAPSLDQKDKSGKKDDKKNDDDDDMLLQTEDGRYYKDFYKVLADWETADDWTSIIMPLKEEQLQFESRVLTRVDVHSGVTSVSGSIGMAYEGNILEAVNLALNPFDRHYVDRDLMRTGLSLILITPGAGKFHVDKKLLRLTNERMSDNGIAMDLVCLARLPLHITPLLRYQSGPPPEELVVSAAAAAAASNAQEGGGFARHHTTTLSPDIKAPLPSSYSDPLYHDTDDALGKKYTYYAVPHWIDCSFYSHETGQFMRNDSFKTRCKMFDVQMMGLMESDIATLQLPLMIDDVQPPTRSASMASTMSAHFPPSLRTKQSSSSLNDKDDSQNITPMHLQGAAPSSLGNGESYLSRSANFAMTPRRSSFHPPPPPPLPPSMANPPPPTEKTIDPERYDALVFKDSYEPRFHRRGADFKGTNQPSTASKWSATKNGPSRTSMDTADSDHSRTNWKYASGTTTWHHHEQQQQRRMAIPISQSQQAGGKITFFDPKEDAPQHGAPHGSNRESSPTYTRPGGATLSRRNTSGDLRPLSSGENEDDESVVISSSTVEPVPIGGNKSMHRVPPGKISGPNTTTNPAITTTSGGGVTDAKMTVTGNGSLPSLHKHASGNSDHLRTTTHLAANRSSPSHHAPSQWNSHRSIKSTSVNPCFPAGYTALFTSHLRRWQHALPKQATYDGPVVYWKSLATPACLPLTTDYFPSNDELKLLYTHYMYTVSASEDVNLYQAGDRNLSELKKTEILLTEMISQRLAQGFQIIVDITGSSNYQKTSTSAAAAASKVVNPMLVDQEDAASLSSATMSPPLPPSVPHVAAQQARRQWQQQQVPQQPPVPSRPTGGISHALSRAAAAAAAAAAANASYSTNALTEKSMSTPPAPPSSPAIIKPLQPPTTTTSTKTRVASGLTTSLYAPPRTLTKPIPGPPSTTEKLAVTAATAAAMATPMSTTATGTNGTTNTATATTSGGQGVLSTTLVGDHASQGRWKHMVWWLSMGHQVHQLTFDPSGQNVEVRRYVREVDFDDTKIGYKCAIWPKNVDSYRPKAVTFSYTNVMYAWNYLDHLVAGYQEELTDNLRFWRARFIVIPREKLPSNTLAVRSTTDDRLNDEERRLVLFDTWLQTLRKAKWFSPVEREEMQRRKKKEIGPDFGLKLTTMDPSTYLTIEAAKAVEGRRHHLHSDNDNNANVHAMSSFFSSSSPLHGSSKDAKSLDIVNAMRDPKDGVKIMDRRWHFKVFRGAFIGSEAVDWLIAHFDDINSRTDAVKLGNDLMKRDPPLFVSSSNRHGFLDGHYFYQFHEEFAPGHQRSWFLTTRSSSAARRQVADPEKASSDQTSSEKDDEKSDSTATAAAPVSSTSSSTTTTTTTNATTPSGPGTPATAAPPPEKKKKTTYFDMARSMIIDVDPYKKSNRRETAILHYDTIHNANNCYHFQLHWMGCTAQLVQELLRAWSLQADRCGLKLVEGSVEQAYAESENNNPFQCPVPITLAQSPPPVTELAHLFDVPDQFYEIALVRHLGFVLDVEADDKYERARANAGVQVRYPYLKYPYKYDQYIHRTGVAFVQIRPDGKGFYWVNNRLYTNHTPALAARRRDASSHLQHPDYLRRLFVDACSDKDWLAAFWTATRNQLLHIKDDTKDEDEDDGDDLVHDDDPAATAGHDTLSRTTSSTSTSATTLTTTDKPEPDTNKKSNKQPPTAGGFLQDTIGRWVFENARAVVDPGLPITTTTATTTTPPPTSQQQPAATSSSSSRTNSTATTPVPAASTSTTLPHTTSSSTATTPQAASPNPPPST
ncbi:hypothetical protein BC940DRAFT_261795 [Gongronella butleri]|nr:hypothetical protein BC940DRAFT_261795 [Gongronella butleri]